MSKKSVRLAAGGILAVAICLLLSGSSVRPDGRQVEVQVQGDYGVEPAQTDAGKAIDMAERVALQGQQATQDQLARIDAKLDKVLDKLAAMEKQSGNLGKRLGAIEQRLGMVPPQQALPTGAAQPGLPVPQPQVAQPAKPVN
jgi:hypothetical protein